MQNFCVSLCLYVLKGKLHDMKWKSKHFWVSHHAYGRNCLILLHFWYIGFPGGCINWVAVLGNPLRASCSVIPRRRRWQGWWCTPEINLHSPSSTSLAFPLGLSQTGGKASSLLQGDCPTSAALGYNNERDTYNGRFCFLYNQWQWWKSHSILLASFTPLCNISH